VNLILAFVLLTAAGIVAGTVLGKDDAPAWGERVFVFLYTGGWLNLALMALNLIPVPPLDGSRILASASVGYRQLLMHPNAGIFGIAFFMLVFWVTPFGSTVIGLLQSVALLWTGVVQGLFI
jgi:Zn-dependent protease